MTKLSLVKYVLGLVGTKYRPSGPAILKCLEDDHPICLVREPENPHDPNAIAVYVQIGYIPANQASRVSGLIVGTAIGQLKNRSLVEVELEKKDEQATSSS